MTRLEDLTIFLKEVDNTKSVFGKVQKRMENIGRVAKLVGKAVGAIGALAVAGLTRAFQTTAPFID